MTIFGPPRALAAGVMMPFPDHRDMQQVMADERRHADHRSRCMECGAKTRNAALCSNCRPHSA